MHNSLFKNGFEKQAFTQNQKSKFNSDNRLEINIKFC